MLNAFLNLNLIRIQKYKKYYITAMLVICLCFFCNEVKAQFYTLGNEPASVKWNILRSENYKLIYPQEIDSLARRYLSLMETCRQDVMRPLDILPDPIPVILHPYSAMSNGSVVWTPKRVELFTIPSSEGYSQMWDEQLALHESRHIGQVEHFTRGLIAPFYWLLGEQAPGAGVGLFATRWLLEGDAVIAETELSDAGRGREASFLQYYRAAFLNGDYRNWDKWTFGSYREYTPNEYPFGYLVNAGSRFLSGKYDYMSELLPQFVKNWYYLFYYDTRTYKDVVGRSFGDVFRFARDTTAAIWREDLRNRGSMSANRMFNVRKRRYADYTCVLPTDRDSVVYALRSGMDYTPELVRVEGGIKYRTVQELDAEATRLAAGVTPTKRPRRIVYGKGERFSDVSVLSPMSYYAETPVISGNRIYWVEKVPHIRWGNVYYSDIFEYDLDKRKKRRVTRGKYYVNPMLSATGDSLYVSEYDVRGGSSIVMLDTRSGKVLDRSGIFRNVQFKEISPFGESLVFTAITRNGLGFYFCPHRNLKKLSLDSPLITGIRSKVEGLTSYCGVITFSTDFDGVDNIYALSMKDTSFYKLTNSLYGATRPYVRDRKLFYSDYSHYGYVPAWADSSNCVRTPVDWEDRFRHPIADYLSDCNPGGDPFDASSGNPQYNADTLQSKRYRKGLHLFRFHSWAPVYYNVDKIMSMSFDRFYEVASLGAVLFSQNSLSTAETMIGYSYHNGFHSGHLKFTYTGWYPVIELSADINDDYRYTRKIEYYDGGVHLWSHPDRTPHLVASVNVYVPLNFSSGGWSRGLIPQMLYSFDNSRYYSYRKERYTYAQKMVFGARYYQMLPVTQSGIFPRWGFSLSGYCSMIPGSSENFGSMLYLYGYGYLPGITREQGLRLSVSYQKQFLDGKLYYQGNMVNFPRGYTTRASAVYVGGTADYAIPIYLGDVSWWTIAYWKRMQIIPFVDYGRNYTASSGDRMAYQDMWSVGTDILFDANFFSTTWPVSIGVRYSYTGESPLNLSLLFNVSLN